MRPASFAALVACVLAWGPPRGRAQQPAPSKLSEFLGLLDVFPFWFNVVTP